MDDTDWMIPDRYDEVKFIAKGAYGMVCSALDGNTKTKICIKRILRLFDCARSAKIVLREIKILKHVSHDNVINLLDIYSSEDDVDTFNDVYLIVPFMEKSLHDRIYNDTSALTDDDRLIYMYQILQGLRYLHSCDIIHRDLKPTNIAVTGRDLKIIDFGQSRDRRNDMTEYVVTRCYRAPEIILNPKHYDAAVDIWSAACIFVEMFTRRVMFHSANLVEHLTKIIRAVGFPSDEYMNEINPFLRDFVEQNREEMAVGTVEKFSDNFPEIDSSTVEGKELIAFFHQLLKINPNERLDAKTAVKHTYLRKYYDEDDDIDGTPFSNNFENNELNVQDLRAIIFEELGTNYR